MSIHLALWVTSRCNLHCPHCSQAKAMATDPKYHMPMWELRDFIRSSQRRDIRYAAIEITGGEPTLWPIIAEGVQELYKADICDWLTTVTNGNNAHEASQLFRRYMPVYGVSSSQATPEQVAIHRTTNPSIFLNDHAHKPLPQVAVPNSLPANCCVSMDRNGVPVTPLAYYQGQVYHCCNARALGGFTLSVPFEDDFVSHFAAQPRDQEICSRCLCNARVWNSL